MLQTYIVLFGALVLTVLAQILLKFGVNKIGSIEINLGSYLNLIGQAFTNLYIFSGLVSLGVGFFLWLMALSKLKLSVIVPFASFNYILILFFSWLLFKESISYVQLLGVGVIIGGLILITR